jgi:hypothetical protein
VTNNQGTADSEVSTNGWMDERTSLRHFVALFEGHDPAIITAVLGLARNFTNRDVRAEKHLSPTLGSP